MIVVEYNVRWTICIPQRPSEFECLYHGSHNIIDKAGSGNKIISNKLISN